MLCKEKEWENRGYSSDIGSSSTGWRKEWLFPANVIPKHLMYPPFQKHFMLCGRAEEREAGSGLRMRSASSAPWAQGGCRDPPHPTRARPWQGEVCRSPDSRGGGPGGHRVGGKRFGQCIFISPPALGHSHLPERHRMMRFGQDVRFTIK